MEIYNEKVRDLLVSTPLSPNKLEFTHNLKIREHPKEGPYVESKSVIALHRGGREGENGGWVGVPLPHDDVILFICLDLSRHSVSDFEAITKLMKIGNNRR